MKDVLDEDSNRRQLMFWQSLQPLDYLQEPVYIYN